MSHKKQGKQADNLRKEGFDRDRFFQKTENKFDQRYNFQRAYFKTYENFRNRNNTSKLEKMGKQQVKSMLKKPVNMIKNEVMKVSGVHELSKINPLKIIPLSIPVTPMQAVMLGVKVAKKVIDLGR
jgi:sugar-specific transcriptional regulator TrmB